MVIVCYGAEYAVEDGDDGGEKKDSKAVSQQAKLDEG
jgi:hypothetical protein